MKMRRITAILLPILLSFTAYAAEFTLSGKNLTTEQVTRIARDNSIKVTYGESASKAVSDSFDLVMEAALQGRPVYGLTVGVGWNKDQPVFAEKDGKRVLNEDLVALSKAFNLTSLRAHGGGIGAPMPKDVVRASMVIRLNQILTGRTGVQPEVAQMYLAFLNSGIVPVVPSRGSVGEADITQLSHIGLAMVGEGDVFYQGTEMPAKEALDKAGLAPLDIIGKDFLSILSNNSLTAAHSTLMAEDVESYLHKQAVVFALMLEGYNGNVAPFLKGTAAIRPFPGFQKGAALLNDALDGSYLWQPSNQRALQDPLSFRNAAYTIGNALESQNQLEAMLEIHINHSDDNPVVVVDAPRDGISEQEKNYFIEGDVSGAIFPTANFEILPVGARVEGLNRALVRLSQSITMQTIRLENPALTKLSRFLSAEGNNGTHLVQCKSRLSRFTSKTLR